MYISRRYRPNKWPFWGLIFAEFPVTVALLALFGIAAPNLYRTKLWEDGAANGFNSSPKTAVYAAANYRPYSAPQVWGQFITNYNLVISVLSMFLLLVKTVMYMLHVFPPLLSVLCHALLVALYIVSCVYQAGSDMSDPKRPQPGAPWYIAKPCSVARDQGLVGYCMQAKAAFACSVLILIIFFGQLCLAIWSLFPSPSHRAEREQKRLARESRWAHLDSPTMESKLPALYLDEISSTSNLNGDKPTTGAALNPMTPRTLAFNRLGGTKDLPLRDHFDHKAQDKEIRSKGSIFSSRFALRSPTFPGTPLSPRFRKNKGKGDEEDPDSNTNGTGAGAGAGAGSGNTAPGTAMYFPPPPKIPASNGK